MLGAALALNSTSAVPSKAAVFDAQNGMGFGNNLVYDGTQYVNTSNNAYARTAGLDGTPTWAQANFTLVIPQGAKVLDATLALEHQQDAAGQITVNVSANNGTAWYWGICSIPPLDARDTDVLSYCNLTSYVTWNVSLLQVYLNMTYASGTKRESIDLMRLNYTYIMPANLTGNMTVYAPANGTVLDADLPFNMSGDYSISCSGGAGSECGPTVAYAEYCLDSGCTNFQRINGSTDVYNLTANGISCGYMLPGDNCSGQINATVASKPGKYRLRILAHPYSNDIASQANLITAYGVMLTGWTPPYNVLCYDPVGGHGLYDCTSEVDVQDLGYAGLKYNPPNQPGWANANFSFFLPADAIIENVSVLAVHIEDNPSRQNGTAYYWDGGAWQRACNLTMSSSDHGDVCSLPVSYFANSSRLETVRLRFEFNTSSGASTAFLDFLGMRVNYKVPFVANFTGSVALDSPPERQTMGPGTDFWINGTYSLQCAGPPESECRWTKVFAEYCFGEGCTDFRRVDTGTSVYNVTINEASCGFLTGGQNCSGNITVSARANAGKYTVRLRANSYVGDILSGTSIISLPGASFTPCTSLYSGICNSPATGGIYDCTSQANAVDNVYANLRYTPVNQPGWMNATFAFSLPFNSYITNVSSRLTHRIERPDRQTGTESVWNVTGWDRVCDLSMLTYDHTDTCDLPLSIFQSAASLENIRTRAEYYTSLGTSNAWADYMCAVVAYRVPLATLDRTEYFLGYVINLTGDYWAPSAPLRVDIYQEGNLTSTAPVATNGSGVFNYFWLIDNVTIRKEYDMFTVNVSDVLKPWIYEFVTVRVWGCEAYVAERDEPCSIQCPSYTNYTISVATYERDEYITSSFKVCHI